MLGEESRAGALALGDTRNAVGGRETRDIIQTRVPHDLTRLVWATMLLVPDHQHPPELFYSSSGYLPPGLQIKALENLTLSVRWF